MKGKCCKNIGLRISPDNLKNSYMRFLNKGNNGNLSMNKEGMHYPEVYQDIHLIYPMLEFLFSDNTHPDGDVETEYTVFHYKCKLHDSKTGLCTINDIKPSMCLDYPLLRESCRYEGCSCLGDRRKEVKNNKRRKKSVDKLRKLE